MGTGDPQFESEISDRALLNKGRKLECKFCAKICKNDNSLRNHERLCPKNEDRVYVSLTIGKPAWNRGLTKETDDRVLAYSVTISKLMKGKPSNMVWTEERRKEKSEWRKSLHAKNPDTHPNRRCAGNRNKMTYPEKVAYDYLTKTGIEFKHQQKILKYYPDFLIGNIIIEIDGARWHNKERDNIRDCELTNVGFKIFRIDSKENIENRIKEIIVNHVK